MRGKKFRLFTRLICAILVLSILITNSYCVENIFALEDRANLYVSGTEEYDRSFEVLEKLNTYRKKAGISNLKMDKSLVQGAMTRAAENTIYFGIIRPDGSGFFSAEEFSDISYTYQDCTKILLSQQSSYSSADSTALQIVNDGYFNSLLMDSSIKSMGIGVFNYNNRYYNVIIFSQKEANTYTNRVNKSVEKKITATSNNISLNIENSTESINVSNKVTMAVYNYDQSVNYYVKINNKSFTWTSSNSNIASVSPTGQVTGISSGTATIKGSLPTGQSVSCTVRVSNPNAISQVKNLKQSSNSTSTITLSWDKVSNATGYEVQRYNASTKTYSTIKSLTSTTYKDTERTSATVYKYRVRAYKTVNGKKNYGSYSSVINCATDPLAVKNLKRKNATTSDITIEWDKVSRADGYVIYRATSKDGTYSKINTVDGSIAYYSDKGLSSGKTYYYKVRAYKKADTTNYGSYSNVLTATTRPATVGNFEQSSSTTSSITLSWSKVSSASGYEIRRATSKDGEYKVLKKITGNSTTTYTNSLLSSGSKYYYQIRAYKVLDGTTYYSDLSNKISAACKPSQVTGLKKESSTDSDAKLSWKKVASASGYEIRRATSKDGTYSKIDTVSGSSTLTYTDKNISSGKIYYYKVRAYKSADKNQYGAYSSSVSAVIYPKQVTNVKKISGTSTSTKLSWSKVDSASGYKIERATSKDGKYTQIKKITSSSTTTYTDTGLTNNKTYYYRIKAYKTISSKEYDGKYSSVLSAKCIKLVPVTSISLDQSSKTIKVNEEFSLTATIKPSDATDKKIIWKSSNTSVATVDSTGKVKGVGRGSVTISAVSNFDNKIEATCTVTVNDINSPDIFVKQETDYTCTLASAVMLYRRELCLQGKAYNQVTETNLRPYAWTDGQGLNGTIVYEGMRVEASVDIAYKSDKKSDLIKILKNHEEGIIIYDYSKPHAVLLTDYDASNDTFYCADPQSDAPTGRIKLESAKMYGSGNGSTQDKIINNIDHIWYVVK